MSSPFELDCARKNEALLQFRDKRARRQTCYRCGVIRRYHNLEVAMGRCDGFRAMNLKQWAEWLGVEISEHDE